MKTVLILAISFCTLSASATEVSEETASLINNFLYYVSVRNTKVALHFTTYTATKKNVGSKLF